MNFFIHITVMQPQTNNFTANPSINPAIVGGTNNVSSVTDSSNRRDAADRTSSNNDTDIRKTHPANHHMPHNSYSVDSDSLNPNLYHSNEYPYVAPNVPVNRDTTYNRASYNGPTYLNISHYDTGGKFDPTYPNINRRNSDYHSDLSDSSHLYQPCLECGYMNNKKSKTCGENCPCNLKKY